MKKTLETKRDPGPPSIPKAASRFVAAYFGGFALAGTYLVAVLRGVSAPAAFGRAVLAWAIAWVFGRFIGFFLGRVLLDRPAAVPATVPAVATEVGA